MNQTQEFLQSEEWLQFQEAAGKEVIRISQDDFSVKGIAHTLPMVGTYLYTPRWPMEEIRNELEVVIARAREKKAAWIRIEPTTEVLLEEVKKALSYKIVKAPHDMQPREHFIIDIAKTEEELLAAMKSKVRYNIRLAEKKAVKVFVTRERRYQEAFFALIDATAKRQHILPHPRSYYEKYFSVFSEAMCELWVAEYQGKVLAANIVLFYGAVTTYLHGGTSDEHRDVMAPVLLQWAQIREAKKRGCTVYDFGGVNMNQEKNGWEGITRFKTGFSPETTPTMYPGSYDIILDVNKYWLYDRLRHLQAGLALLKKYIC